MSPNILMQIFFIALYITLQLTWVHFLLSSCSFYVAIVRKALKASRIEISLRTLQNVQFTVDATVRYFLKY